MVGRIIVINGYQPDSERLHVYGCTIKDLDDSDKQNHLINSLTVGILVETRNDFKYENQLLHSESESYQIRPKVLFKNSKGLFYKEKNKRVYITEKKEQEVYEYTSYWKTLDWQKIIEEKKKRECRARIKTR